MQGLSGKAAIVTGGGAGIGRAICLRLAQEGATIGILDRDAAGARETAGLIAEAGGRAHDYDVDITTMPR